MSSLQIIGSLKKVAFAFGVMLLAQGCIPVFYDHAVPTRRISLSITDEMGRPLPQARLIVKTPALKTPKQGLPASEEGKIELESPGYIHGGGGFLILGFIPFGISKLPTEHYRVVAGGYQALEFNQQSLFLDSCKKGSEAAQSGNWRNRVDVLIYERTVVLRKDKT